MRFPVKLLATALLLWSGAVHAEGGYFGGVAGLVNTDLDGDSPLNAGIRAGYSWGSGFGLEGEYTSSVVDGESEVDNGFVNFDYQYSVSTAALYGTYRSAGDVYFKGRLGFSSADVPDGDGDDNGVLAGVGLGFRLSPAARLELEYASVGDGADFWGGSLNYHF